MTVNIRDHGATTTALNNRSAINSAIAQAISLGAACYIPAGNFRYEGQLSANGAVLIYGDGETSIISAGSASAQTLEIRGEGVRLNNFRKNGVNSARLDVPWASGVWVNGATGFLIENVHIDGPAGVGIMTYSDFGPSSYGTIRYNTIERTRADSIHMTNGTHHMVVHNNYIVSSGDDGVAVVSYVGDANGISHDVHIYGNTVLRNNGGRGITCVGGQNVLMESNHIQGGVNDRAGIYISAENEYGTHGVLNCRAVGNTIVAAGQPTWQGAILLYNSQVGQSLTGITLADNQIIDYSGIAGLHYTGAGRIDVVASNNAIYKTSGTILDNSASNISATSVGNTLGTTNGYGSYLVPTAGGIGTGTTSYNRRYYSASSTDFTFGAVSTYSSSTVTLTMNFTPRSNERVLFMWNAYIQVPFTDRDYGVALFDGSTMVSECLPRFVNNREKLPMGGLYLKQYDTNPGQQTLTIRYKAPGGGDVENFRRDIFGLVLGDNDTATALANTVTLSSSTYTSRLGFTVQPWNTRRYLVMAAMTEQNQSSTANTTFSARLYNSTNATTLCSCPLINGPSTTSQHPMFMMDAVTLTAETRANIHLQGAAGTNLMLHQTRYPVLAAIALDGFQTHYYADRDTTQSATSTTYTDHLSLAATPAGSVHLYLSYANANAATSNWHNVNWLESRSAAGTVTLYTATAQARADNAGAKSLVFMDCRTAVADHTSWHIRTALGTAVSAVALSSGRILVLPLSAGSATVTSTLTANLDAVLRATKSNTATIDGKLLHQGFTRAADLNGVVMRTTALAASIDASVVRQLLTLTTGLDAKVLHTMTPTTALDGVVNGTKYVIAQLTGMVQHPGFTVSAELDGIVSTGSLLQTFLDGRLFKSDFTVQTDLDCDNPMKQVELSVGLDAFAQAVQARLLNTNLDAYARRTWVPKGRQTTNWRPVGTLVRPSTATAASTFLRSCLTDATMSSRRHLVTDLDTQDLVIRGNLTLALDCAIGIGTVQCFLDGTLYGTAEPLLTSLDSLLNREQTGLKQTNLHAVKLHQNMVKAAFINANVARNRSVTTDLDADDIFRRITKTTSLHAVKTREQSLTRTTSLDAIKISGGGGGSSNPRALRVNPNSAAPLVNNVVTINVGTGGWWGTLQNDQDALFVMPNAIVTGVIHIENGRNVRIIGGQMRAQNQSGALIERRGGYGCTYIEGLHMDPSPAGAFDCMRGGGNANTAPMNWVVQNCFIDHVAGNQNATHGDIFQAYGDPQTSWTGSMDFDWCATYGEYQTLFVPDQGSTTKVTGPLRISRMTMRYHSSANPGGYHIWVKDVGQNNNAAIYYEPSVYPGGYGVWIQPNPRTDTANACEQSHWPKRSQGCASSNVRTTSAQTVEYIQFTGSQNISGRLYVGFSPTGDQVRPKVETGNQHDPGIGYVSPGYLA